MGSRSFAVSDSPVMLRRYVLGEQIIIMVFPGYGRAENHSNIQLKPDPDTDPLSRGRTFLAGKIFSLYYKLSKIPAGRLNSPGYKLGPDANEYRSCSGKFSMNIAGYHWYIYRSFVLSYF